MAYQLLQSCGSSSIPFLNSYPWPSAWFLRGRVSRDEARGLHPVGSPAILLPSCSNREVRARGLEAKRRDIRKRVHSAFATALYQEKACQAQTEIRRNAEKAVATVSSDSRRKGA